MSTDWADDPESQAWIRHVLGELVPMIEDSSITVSLIPHGPTDVKFAVELGLSIMLDKPIVLVVSPGGAVPDHLRRVADDIVESGRDLPAAIDRAVRRLAQ